MSEETPKWISEAVHDARRLFGMGGADWHFYVKMTDKPADDDGFDGSIRCNAVYQTCDIELNTTLENDSVGLAAIYHEVLHGSHESIDHLVQDAILEKVPKKERKLLGNLYRDEVENFVQRIARSIVENLRKEDKTRRFKYHPLEEEKE
jgi:hypothetical protein